MNRKALAPWLHLAQATPARELRLIYRVSIEPERAAALLREYGLAVSRTFRLLPAVAAQGRAAACVAAAAQEWVVGLEEDQEVRAL